MRVKLKDIKDKYISPPNTTDFAIMFLPNVDELHIGNAVKLIPASIDNDLDY